MQRDQRKKNKNKEAEESPVVVPRSNPESKKTGRPSDYTEEMAEKILDLVSSGTKGLKTICEENEDLPHRSTIRRWIATNEAFRDRYARAKEEQADLVADQILEISDQLDLETDLTHEKISRAKLQIDARKWIASKLKPKTYGDKIDATTNGESLNGGFMGLLMSTQDE